MREKVKRFTVFLLLGYMGFHIGMNTYYLIDLDYDHIKHLKVRNSPYLMRGCLVPHITEG